MRQQLLWPQIPLRWREDRQGDGWRKGRNKSDTRVKERESGCVCERCVSKGPRFPERCIDREKERQIDMEAGVWKTESANSFS